MKRIISTILTVSMLFTMLPAFASDIDVDVNSIPQLYSVGSGEAVYASSAEKINVIKSDFSSLEVGTYSESKTGKNGKVNIKQGSGGTFTVNDDGSVTLKQAAGGNENASFVFDYTPKTGMVVSSYKVKFDVLSTSWTRFEYSNSFSSLYVSGGKFGLNNTYRDGSETMGKTVSITDTVSAGKWYTVTYIIDTDAKTYKLDIVDEDGNSVIVTTEEEWSFRPTSGGAITGSVGGLSINTAQGGQSEISVKDVYAYQVVSVCGFDVIGPETLVEGNNSMRLEYNNTTDAEVDFNALIVAYDADGVVVGTDVEAGTIAVGSGDIDLEFNVPEAESYKVFVNDVNGASLCIKAGGVSTKAPENFADVSCTADGDIAVAIEKDSAYNVATVVVYDEEENIVGYAQQKNAGTPVVVPVSSYNIEYTVEVILNDAAHNVVAETASIIAWNPEIAADFNSGDVEAAIEAHIDAIKLAYDGDFAALYEENAEYINNYIALRDDYQSVYDIVDAIYAAEGFIAVVSAEDEAAFAVAFEENAESFGIAIDSVYEDNKDVIIAKLFAAKDDCIIPEELVETYDDIYVACEFNNAPAILYGKLFAKYASKLGITVGKEYYEAEATYNDAVLARKVADFGGAFDSAEDVANAFRNAAYDIEGKPAATYATVGASPLTKPVRTVNFEANSSQWAVTSNIDPVKGDAQVVNVDGNNMFKITQYAGYEDVVTFAVNALYTSAAYDSLNIKERIMFETFDTGYILLRTRAAYLYVENNKWGINYGGGKMDTSGTLEDITSNVWYNLDFDFDFPAKKFDLVITKDDGTVVFEDYDCDFRGNDADSMMIQTPHKDGKDSNGVERTTTEDTIIYVDDVVITAPCEEAVYYTAKSADKFNAGVNGVAVELENLTGADRDINVYVPVYANGKLYTFANETVYVEDGEKTDVIVSYELGEELFGATPAEIKYEVVVADGFDGVNHSVVSKTTAGILSVDASVDYEAEIITVATESTFDNGTILVLAPGATIDSADAADVIYYGVAKNVDIKVVDGIVGDINVYAVAQNAEGQVTVADATVYYPGNGVAEQLVADFAVVTDETVADTVAQYIDIIDSVEPGTKDFYEANTDAVNSALVANKPYASTQDIVNTIKSVKVLAALDAASDIDEFEQAFAEFADMFDVELDAIYTANEDLFMSELYAQKATFATYADVMAAYDVIYMVCDFNTATEDTIGAKLAKYAADLGIALDEVYTSKQIYVDRLVAADIPFATADEIVSSYNNAYAKADALEGDFSPKVVATSAKQISKFVVDFEDCQLVSGSADATTDMPFSFAKAGDGNFDIAIDGDNQHLVVRQSADTGNTTTNVSFNTSSINGDYVTIEYQIRFDKPSSKWTMLNLGDLSSLYLNGNKFHLNESNNAATTTEGKGGQKNISGAVSANVWYTVTYNIDFVAQAYNITIKDETGLEIANTNTKPRYWATKKYTSVPNLQLFTPQSEAGEYQVSYDNIVAYATPQSGTYYTITGTSTLIPGENTLKAAIENADNVANVYNIFVPVYDGGRLVSANKSEVTVEAKSKADVDIDIIAPATGNVDYDVFVVESIAGVNYAIASEAVLPRTTEFSAPTADYTNKSIKVNGTTTNDNVTILVTAPVADGRDYDITEAEHDAGVIAYYAPAKLTKTGFEEDKASKEKIYTSTFAADIKIPDGFVDGTYNIYFISQNKAGDVQVTPAEVYYAGNSKLDDMLVAFNNLTDANVSDTVESYMDVLMGVADDVDAFYIANEATVNEALLAAGNFANVGEINAVIFSIYAVDKMAATADDEEFKSVFEYYANVFDVDTTDAAYVANAQQVCERLFADKDELTCDNVKSMYENALMFAEFDNATRDNIEDVLRKYEEVTGIDADSADYKKYKADINKILAAEDTTYNSIDDIKNAYAKGLKFAKDNKDNNSASKPSSSGGSGGGSGSGSGVISTTVSKPHIETESTISGAAAAFADIDTVPWATEAITALKNYGVINGISETEFAPDRNVTREEFAKMLVNAFAISGEGKTFADVQAGSWYAPYVTALASSGVVNGISETEFGVGANITRQDAAVMLDRTAKHIGMELEFDVSALNIFNDYMADYAKDSIYRLYQSGVINGTSATTFSATDSLTRAQAAKLIYGLMQLNK